MNRVKQTVNNIVRIGLVLFFIVLIYRNIDDFETLIQTLSRTDLLYLLVATILGIVNFKVFALIFRYNFKILSRNIKIKRMFSTGLIYHFLSISNPLGVTGSSAYLISYFVGQGFSYVKAILGLLLSNLSLNIAYLFILIFTLYSLNLTDSVERYQWYASFLIFGLILGLVLAISFFVVLPNFRRSLTKKLFGTINRIATVVVRKAVVSEETIERYEDEFKSMNSHLSNSIPKFTKTILPSLAFHTLNILILAISFYMFDIEITVRTILTLYGVITLFTIISPTPQGIGIVEGLAHTAAISVGINSSGALLAILTYRVAIIWVPALVGVLLFKKYSLGDSNDITPV